MIAISIELIIIGLFLLFLFFFSLVEGAIMHSSPLALRIIIERGDRPEPALLSLVIEDRMKLLVPLRLGTQASVIIVAILATHLSLQKWQAQGMIYSFGFIFLISVIFGQLLPRLLAQNEPEKKLVVLMRSFGPLYRILRLLSLPILSVLHYFKKLQADVTTGSNSEDEETTDEEIQAYLDIGEDEGILQEEDAKLIQSVVEFGNTLTREVMTPRTKIVACEETASLAELREIMIRHRHSRIPIFRRDIDHIIGVAYIRQLVAEDARGKEANSIAGLVHPALFVPETKPVSKLLKELQERGDHMAIVIDEFGGVAGLATIEDLVEEIVGEIRDEDEANISKIIEEGTRSYVVGGNTELVRLEELTGEKFEDLNCSTAAGLVVTYLGRVPAPGEAFEIRGLRVQILDADRKRVHWMRIRLPEPKANSSDIQSV